MRGPLRKLTPRRLGAGASLAAGAAGLLALGGCGVQVKTPKGDLVAGKKAFVQKCGSCHVLARAQTKGTTGPDLDAAFVESLHDGFRRSVVRGIVDEQIAYPNRNGVMPQGLAKGREAENIAAYVAYAVAKPGKDTGLLAAAVGGAQKALVVAKAGSLQIDASPTGQLQFQAKAAKSKSGKVTIKSQNKSSTPHDIAVKGPGVNAVGKVVKGGGVSQITVNLKPGKYTFLCTVPGHAQAGMKGPLTVS